MQSKMLLLHGLVSTLAVNGVLGILPVAGQHGIIQPSSLEGGDVAGRFSQVPNDQQQHQVGETAESTSHPITKDTLDRSPMPDKQPSSHQIATMYPMDDSELASWLTGALAEQMSDEDDEDDDLSESRPIKDQVDTSNRDDDSSGSGSCKNPAGTSNAMNIFIRMFAASQASDGIERDSAEIDDVNGLLSPVFPNHVGATKDVSTDTVNRRMVVTFQRNMQFATAVYCRSVNRAGEWTCGKFCEGLTQGTIIKHLLKDKNTVKYGHAVGVVAVKHGIKAINVIFRGSSNPGDWSTSLKVRKSDAFKEYFQDNFQMIPKGVKIHSGFLSAYMRVHDQVRIHVDILRVEYPDYSINYIGHSLGGALAAIALVNQAVKYGPSEFSRLHLYSYGAPRIGNMEWSKWVSNMEVGSLNRIVNMDDPVVHLPSVYMGYTHIGVTYALNSKRLTFKCTQIDGTGETSDCSTVSLLSPDLDAHTQGYYSPSDCSPDLVIRYGKTNQYEH
ncbi:hypothetical protein BASA82_001211 [Batrachochytrium salamandrivorans]|nr:hypothetical protein BASA82_001211 [Batrachochytrium salamandrivorans]